MVCIKLEIVWDGGNYQENELFMIKVFNVVLIVVLSYSVVLNFLKAIYYVFPNSFLKNYKLISNDDPVFKKVLLQIMLVLVLIRVIFTLLERVLE